MTDAGAEDERIDVIYFLEKGSNSESVPFLFGGIGDVGPPLEVVVSTFPDGPKLKTLRLPSEVGDNNILLAGYNDRERVRGLAFDEDGAQGYLLEFDYSDFEWVASTQIDADLVQDVVTDLRSSIPAWTSIYSLQVGPDGTTYLIQLRVGDNPEGGFHRIGDDGSVESFLVDAETYRTSIETFVGLTTQGNWSVQFPPIGFVGTHANLIAPWRFNDPDGDGWYILEFDPASGEIVGATESPGGAGVYYGVQERDGEACHGFMTECAAEGRGRRDRLYRTEFRADAVTAQELDFYWRGSAGPFATVEATEWTGTTEIRMSGLYEDPATPGSPLVILEESDQLFDTLEFRLDPATGDFERVEEPVHKSMFCVDDGCYPATAVFRL